MQIAKIMTGLELKNGGGKLLHCLWLACLFLYSCKSTKHVPEGQYLLTANHLKIRSDKTITNKGVLEDQLNILVLQKPNTYWSGIFPFKLWRFNARFAKYGSTPQTDLPKSIERPVLYDSALQRRTATNMRSFLMNQGYFNAQVTDTVRFKKKKAYASYNIVTGLNYLVDTVFVDADNKTIGEIIRRNMDKTLFKKEKQYTKALADEERTRIITLLQNHGYYKFSQDNVAFELDTVSKEKFRDAENLFESAINFLTLQKRQKKLSLDIKVIIRTDDSTVYKPYHIGRMVVFPDFIDRSVAYDSNMIVKHIDSISYRYYKYYVREQVLDRQIFVHPGELYARSNHELTINKLNELGIFQMVNIYFVEDTSRKGENILNCFITLNPTKRSEAGASYEIASATTYWLGNSVGVNYRDRNFFRGANLFSITAMGGIESGFNKKEGSTIMDHFFLQSTNFGVNASLLFPKFLSPVRPKWIRPDNLPKTQLQFGVNMLDRINLFRLSNISSSFSYNWHRNRTQTWDFTPAFANIVLPVIRPAFQVRLDSNDYLKNSYRRTFIEGENLAFTYSDQEKKQNRNYNYIRISVEEAGILLAGINTTQKHIRNGKEFIFDQYVKLDLDARRYFNARHSLLATRFLAGVGSPYGGSRTLPYIKQYFVGGPYSIRGWRPRTLGPKNTQSRDSTFIDRTGDIKLEMNVEYRFDMIQLFSGVLNLNGALFADAGNIWLAKRDDNTPNGQFDISRLGHDIAVSTGAGLRVIVAGFFTVRMDAAFPIKNPYVAANNGWILKSVDLGNSSWRKDNVVLNLAIGMPF